jgi:pilus assembly protein CpaE
MSAREMRIFLAVDDRIDYDAIRSALPPGAPVVEAPLSGDSRPLAIDDPVDVIVVGCGEESDHALRFIEAARAQRPEAPVVVLYGGSPNGFMEAAFEAGAEDLITLANAVSDLPFTLEKVIARRRGAGTATALSPMITVLGPKGGTGKTLTACNLGVALAAEGARSVIVDLDLQFGDVGLALGLRPTKTIYDLATSVGSLDADKADSFLMTHESGARALLAPIRPDQASAVKIPFLQALFDVLRTRYDYVIVDTPPAFSPEVIATIDAASHLCVVGMLDALSLKDTKIGFETLQQMGYDPADAKLVLNRADTNVGISDEDVARILGRTPDVLVPSDRAIPRAITHGQTIFTAAPRSGAAQAYLQLARAYIANGSHAHAPTEGGTPSRRRLLRRAR